jgi:hypothetical protein
VRSPEIWGRVQGYGVSGLGIWERYRDMGKKVQGYGERVPQNKGEVILLDILHF